LPSNSPHDHMILRVGLVGSHGRRWKRPCLQTAHMAMREDLVDTLVPPRGHLTSFIALLTAHRHRSPTQHFGDHAPLEDVLAAAKQAAGR
jgi:hypothetical protein